jgi:hypothetical protein
MVSEIDPLVQVAFSSPKWLSPREAIGMGSMALIAFGVAPIVITSQIGRLLLKKGVVWEIVLPLSSGVALSTAMGYWMVPKLKGAVRAWQADQTIRQLAEQNSGKREVWERWCTQESAESLAYLSNRDESFLSYWSARTDFQSAKKIIKFYKDACLEFIRREEMDAARAALQSLKDQCRLERFTNGLFADECHALIKEVQDFTFDQSIALALES